MARLKASQRLKRELGLLRGALGTAPVQVLLQVTNRCNMTCDFCDFWTNGVPRNQELDLDEYARLEKQLAELGTFLVSVEGGEPLLRPDIAEIIRCFSTRHHVLVYTNGWRVTPKLAEALYTSGASQVGVSIDYSSAVLHDRRRGRRGAFERAWAAVEHLKKAAPKGGAQVHIMTVVMQDNIDELEPLLELSAAMGVGHHLTLLSTDGFRRAEGARLPSVGISAELLRLRRRFPHLAAPRSYLKRVDNFLSGGALPVCGAGRRSFNIDHQGNVAPCIEHIDRSVGNIRDVPLRELYARLAGDETLGQCQQCWTLCRGLAHALTERSLSNTIDVLTRIRTP